MMEEREAWTVPELARASGLTANRIRALIEAGRFPGVRRWGRDWMIPGEDARRWLEEDRDRRFGKRDRVYPRPNRRKAREPVVGDSVD